MLIVCSDKQFYISIVKKHYVNDLLVIVCLLLTTLYTHYVIYSLFLFITSYEVINIIYILI